jgi:magnesium-transporting ATPase (P-type)
MMGPTSPANNNSNKETPQPHTKASVGKPTVDTSRSAPRLVYLNDEAKNQELRKKHRYANNWVSTSKYTIVTFIPKTLFEFFRVIANMYFLFISVIQLASTWSPTNPYTTAGPLVIVLFVSMIKQAIEDKKRHEADTVQNSRLCNVRIYRWMYVWIDRSMDGSFHHSIYRSLCIIKSLGCVPSSFHTMHIISTKVTTEDPSRIDPSSSSSICAAQDIDRRAFIA